MTDATSRPGADGTRGEGRIGGKGTTGEPTGAHSPLVAPTESEAPDLDTSRGDRDGRTERAGRRESVPGAVPPATGDRDGVRGGEGGLGRDPDERGLGRDSDERGLGRDSAAPGDRTSAVRGGSGHDSRLLPHDECDKLSTRLQHAVAGFVDEPRSAVEEADHVLEEVATRFADAVKQRRRTLRNSWQGGEGKAVDAGDTEQLRLALRDYRELTERLLHS
ncbi:hypothetical protein ABZ307_00580 [Streptomyces griseorubiginosus]|uniref:hypothetical protein n=1 Tax=Streptomyces griseorubiginosus TaxID=67304 RepID=UPI0033B647E2